MKRSRILMISLSVAAIIATTFALVFALGVGKAGASPAVAGTEVLHSIHSMKIKGTCHHNCGGGGNNLTYHGGTTVNGVNVGVETGQDKVYLVYWGSQWSSDPSGEAAVQQNFFNHVGSSSWNNSVTQYCEGSGVTTTPCTGTHATNPTGVLAGTWYDNASAAPSRPTQSQLANEALNAAAHFGNTTAASNTQVQYVINTATGNNSSGFGTQYCAYHSSVSGSVGTVAWTNMPYITDAGASCGANFNGLGPLAGITIVGGHEFAETESDIYPNTGWLDGSGAENGDKCAWIQSGQGAAASVSMGNASFPVQSLWSNAFNSNAGGCVLSYP